MGKLCEINEIKWDLNSDSKALFVYSFIQIPGHIVHRGCVFFKASRAQQSLLLRILLILSTQKAIGFAEKKFGAFWGKMGVFLLRIHVNSY